ncbi:MAG: type III pantothenate kinase [Trueperaceae bacterium]|nr:type III pantothenate kinase [Trueperaceae bacterium]
MLLAVDVGNTSTVLGLYQGDERVVHWRIGTDARRMSDQYAVLLRNLLALEGTPPPDRAVVSSVVPPSGRELGRALKRYWGIEAMRVTHELVAPLLRVETERPSEVGADRLVNAVAALTYDADAVIAVDFGTATNFDLVVAPDRLLGVALAPGPMVAADALFDRAAKLPRVDLTAPAKAVGRNTVDALRSGLVFGYTEMVDGMVDRIEREVREEIGPSGRLRVIATGGFADVVGPHSRRIDVVDPWLTLTGLARVAQALA